MRRTTSSGAELVVASSSASDAFTNALNGSSAISTLDTSLDPFESAATNGDSSHAPFALSDLSVKPTASSNTWTANQATAQRHQCRQCYKRFMQKAALQRHYEAVHMGKRYACDVCNRCVTLRVLSRFTART